MTRRNYLKRRKILILAVSVFFAALFLFGAIAILAAERAPAKLDSLPQSIRALNSKAPAPSSA